MNTVCEYKMAKAMNLMGGQSVVHRYMSIENQVSIAKAYYGAFYAIGAAGDFLERATELYNVGVSKFCVDVANGDSLHSLDAVVALTNKFPNAVIMGGNVCTVEGFKRLAYAGADLIRVGVGSGAMCKTRVVTGHGVPQLTALLWAREAQKQLRQEGDRTDIAIISDGGIRTSGDIVKALAVADFVMLGSLLAGTDEAPGDIIKENGEEYKLYAGMASEEGRGLNSWFDREKTSFVPEGEAVKLKYKGSVVQVLEELTGGLKVGMSYTGAYTLKEFREKATFVKVSKAGMVEGTPHGKR